MAINVLLLIYKRYSMKVQLYKLCRLNQQFYCTVDGVPIVNTDFSYKYWPYFKEYSLAET